MQKENTPSLGTYTPILVVLLIVAAYLLGMLTTKVQFLENNKKQVAGVQAQITPSQQQQVPQKPQISLKEIKNLFSKNLIKFGDADNKLLLVEVADPSCPYCHAAAGKHPELNAQMGDRFKLVSDGGTYLAPVEEMRKLLNDGKASFVYIYQNGHGNGEMAMKAMYCAYDQGKFWEAHDKLMNNDGYNLINNDIKNDKAASDKLAYFLGDVTDYTTLKTCLDSGKYESRLSDDQQVAQALGVSGTPGFFINATNFVGAYSWTEMKSTADSALK